MEDPAAVTFLHSGPRLAFQVSLWDARPKVAAAAPSISCEHTDSWEEQGISCYVPFFY